MSEDGNTTMNMTKTDLQTSASKAGMQDYRLGRHIHENPYPVTDIRASYWQQGWVDGQCYAEHGGMCPALREPR